MRARRSSISLSSVPSATAVFDPAKPCLPSSPAVGGSMPHLQSNYFVDIILVGCIPIHKIGEGRPCTVTKGIVLMAEGYAKSIYPPEHSHAGTTSHNRRLLITVEMSEHEKGKWMSIVIHFC